MKVAISIFHIVTSIRSFSAPVFALSAKLMKVAISFFHIATFIRFLKKLNLFFKSKILLRSVTKLLLLQGPPLGELALTRFHFLVVMGLAKDLGICHGW